MTHAHLARWMPFEPQQLFSIITRVEDYSQFLPLCSQSRVWNRVIGPDEVERYQAQLTIEYTKLAIHETFTSSVVADPYLLRVTAISRDHPFKSLDCSWILHPARGGTDIEMILDYAMASRTLQLLLSGLFDYVMRKIMTAFEERAQRVLSPAGLPWRH
jgi:coenzyme Q-binding protein COQ10